MISSLNETSIPDLDRRAAARRGDGVFRRACAEEPTASAQAPSRPANPDQVVAEVGGKPITLKDVDAKWEEFDAAERARIVQATYQNRRNMLESIVGDRLIENAAKAAGQTVAAFLDAGRREAPAGDHRGRHRAVLRAEQGPRAGAHARSAARRDQAVPRGSPRAAGARDAGRGAQGEERRQRESDARSAAIHGADARPTIRCAATPPRR